MATFAEHLENPISFEAFCAELETFITADTVIRGCVQYLNGKGQLLHTDNVVTDIDGKITDHHAFSASTLAVYNPITTELYIGRPFAEIIALTVDLIYQKTSETIDKILVRMNGHVYAVNNIMS